MKCLSLLHQAGETAACIGSAHDGENAIPGKKERLTDWEIHVLTNKNGDLTSKNGDSTNKKGVLTNKNGDLSINNL